MVSREQPFDLAAQLRVVGTGAIQQLLARGGGLVERRVEQAIDLTESVSRCPTQVARHTANVRRRSLWTQYGTEPTRRTGVAGPCAAWHIGRMSAQEGSGTVYPSLGAVTPADAGKLVPLVYEELRRLAHRHLQREAAGHTLTTTDLVHQAYLQLAGQDGVQWHGTDHFMAVAATAMRHILVDHARTMGRLKRGGALRRVPLESADIPIEDRAELLLALDEALDHLRELDARQAQVVECRFFAGLTEDETAAALGVSVRTARRDWTKAKAWLYSEIYGDD
jgi:RNA polymerase sigma factor (TIGR02999 family)